MYRLLIVDDEHHVADEIETIFLTQTRMDLEVHKAYLASDALEILNRLKIDVLLTDIQLPGLDGIALLKETRRLQRSPSVIICTRFYSGASMEWAFRYGACYFLCKPVDYERLPELIVDCARADGASREERVDRDDTRAEGVALRALLNQLGISPRLSGGVYLVESVSSLRKNQLLLRNLSRGLYAEVADRLNTTVPRVERSLRSAIASGYDRGAMKDVFSSRPTNREFIEYLLKAVDAPQCECGREAFVR